MFGQVPSLGGDGELFFEALFFEEAGVVAVAGDEFVVGAGSGLSLARMDRISESRPVRLR